MITNEKQHCIGAVIAYVFKSIKTGNHYINPGSNNKTKYITEEELINLVERANNELNLSNQVTTRELLQDGIANKCYAGGIGSIEKMSRSCDYPVRVAGKSSIRNIRIRVA